MDSKSHFVWSFIPGLVLGLGVGFVIGIAVTLTLLNTGSAESETGVKAITEESRRSGPLAYSITEGSGVTADMERSTVQAFVRTAYTGDFSVSALQEACVKGGLSFTEAFKLAKAASGFTDSINEPVFTYTFSAGAKTTPPTSWNVVAMPNVPNFKDAAEAQSVFDACKLSDLQPVEVKNGWIVLTESCTAGTGCAKAKQNVEVTVADE
jgi:hypothetical protein